MQLSCPGSPRGGPERRAVGMRAHASAGLVRCAMRLGAGAPPLQLHRRLLSSDNKKTSSILSNIGQNIGSRFKKIVGEKTLERTMAKVEKLKAYAEGTLGCTMAQLAIAWCLKNENVTTCLLGATKPQQLTETLEAIPVARKLTDADMKAIEAILGNKPEPYQGFGFDAWFRGMNKL